MPRDGGFSLLEFMRRFEDATALPELEQDLPEEVAAPRVLRQDALKGKKVVIIGSGVGGLAAAYEILRSNSDRVAEDNVQVTILEARERTGGRCLTLRPGDSFTEDVDSELHSKPGPTQVVRFEQPRGDEAPYLNAGPGRIPSSHKHLLHYLRRFEVPLEVYVMNSESNMTQANDLPLGKEPIVNRRVLYNTRGRVAELVYQNAAKLLDLPETAVEVEQLKSLMVTFGDLNTKGEYAPGLLHIPTRAGYIKLPGVNPGKPATRFTLNELLTSEYWKKTSVYQPDDFLWQPTMFQPAGGMDRIPDTFMAQVAALGGMLHLNSPVKHISYNKDTKQYCITAEGHEEPFVADYCICNLAIPFLQDIVSTELQSPGGFSKEFRDALQAVYQTQENQHPTKRFLSVTTKVGWQADRNLWQGKPIETKWTKDKHTLIVEDDSQVGVVPIFGGISWTSHPITQIWYPSTGYHDKKGVLTGCYNFGKNAVNYGNMKIKDRLADARRGAALFGDEFAAGLDDGVAIAWQNMPYIKGGWAQWHNVHEKDKHYNNIVQGTGVGGSSTPTFFIVGDQVSQLAGWQEGAILSALNVVSRIADPTHEIPRIKNVPNTLLTVQGLPYVDDDE